MNEFTECEFAFQIIRIDQGKYRSCKFKNCTIEYGGEGPITLVDCVFDSCVWKLIGPARNTIEFLRTMYSSMGEFGKAMVDHTVDNIRGA